MSHLVPNLGYRPFFAENCPLDSFPGATNLGMTRGGEFSPVWGGYPVAGKISRRALLARDDSGAQVATGTVPLATWPQEPSPWLPLATWSTFYLKEEYE